MKALIVLLALVFACTLSAQETERPERPERPSPEKCLEKVLDRVMENFDVDKDGKLDRSELTAMMKERMKRHREGMRGRHGNGPGKGMRGHGKGRPQPPQPKPEK